MIGGEWEMPDGKISVLLCKQESFSVSLCTFVPFPQKF